MSCPGAAGRDASASRFEAAHTSQRYPRASRLTARRSFLQIYERGERVSGSYFVIFGRRGETEATRLGITATRKLGPAVDRNRIKRVIREIFRRSVPPQPPVDIVVNVRASALTTPFPRLHADLLSRISELRRRIGS
ncbi:MAG TPA: ribonuclease P protein component [Candidatus Polarisedimenticolaceae bacterium]|nr:ribonuclease P protein component [Candidatus Polarisedimenticolaceae bacterium]